MIIKLRNGYYFWGNRTGKAQTGLIATNFLNIRQLCCTLKKTIYNVCRRLMFDPNSEILWLNFCNAIRPTLERMMGSQGIKGYRFEKRETLMKGKLFAVIRIIPEIGKIGKALIEGLLSGIGGAVVGIYQWLNDHVFKPIIDSIKKLFGIASPSKVMEEIGINLVEGLAEGVKDL